MIKKNLILGLLFAGSLLLTNCEDDIPAVEYKQQGFIQGTIAGTAQDDATSIDETFKYSRYAPGLSFGEGYSGYTVEDTGEIEIYFYRQDLATGGYAGFEFYLEGEDDTTPNEAYFYLSYIEEESDKVFQFYMGNDAENNLSITDFSFDIATGKLSGNYSIEGPANSTGNEAEVTGSFDVIIKELIQ